MENMDSVRDGILESAAVLGEEVVCTRIGSYDLLVTGGSAWVRTDGEWVPLDPLLEVCLSRAGE